MAETRENHVRRHGIRLSVRSGPPAAVHRLSRRDGSLDANFYDLLASEARLASFIAIAKGDVPAKHWFRLGRTLTPIDGSSGLISWSGSMFEYLMPSLVMRAPAGSLLEQTNRLVVRRQIKYGDGLGMPWGMSESEYNARDIEQTYQYSSFGVPDLGSSAASAKIPSSRPMPAALAAMIDPAAAARNFKRMAGIGARGVYGWYEALDYTRARLPEGTKVAVIRAYMAHHQGMTIVGIANALQDGAMRARFHAEPMMQAAELLLQERMPRDVAVARPPPEAGAGSRAERQPRARRAAPLCLGAFARAAHASSVERTLFDDDDGGGIGLQPLARYRDHPLARGRHLRRLGRLHLPARCAQRRHLVGRLPAKRRGTRQL